MTAEERIEIESIEEFLAHMLVLKCETEDRLQELADCLEVHHNLEVADIFRQLKKRVADSICQIERLAEGTELPAIAIWDYQWYFNNSLESVCIDNAHYLMNKRQALELARFYSRRTRKFLLQVLDNVQIEEVQEIAYQQLKHEEENFFHHIDQWLEEIGDEKISLSDDLDPPN